MYSAIVLLIKTCCFVASLIIIYCCKSKTVDLLAVNSMSNKSASYFPTNSTESNSDSSDSELNFSLGGTPGLIPVQSRTTQGSMVTTYGLQATGSDPRTQQPVAEFDWTSSADLK